MCGLGLADFLVSVSRTCCHCLVAPLTRPRSRAPLLAIRLAFISVLFPILFRTALDNLTVLFVIFIVVIFLLLRILFAKLPFNIFIHKVVRKGSLVSLLPLSFQSKRFSLCVARPLLDGKRFIVATLYYLERITIVAIDVPLHTFLQRLDSATHIHLTSGHTDDAVDLELLPLGVNDVKLVHWECWLFHFVVIMTTSPSYALILSCVCFYKKKGLVVGVRWLSRVSSLGVFLSPLSSLLQSILGEKRVVALF